MKLDLAAYLAAFDGPIRTALDALDATYPAGDPIAANARVADVATACEAAGLDATRTIEIVSEVRELVHEAACQAADLAVAAFTAQIDAMRTGNPFGAALHAAGRYYWPALDAQLDARRDAWIEAALRAGAIRTRIGPAVDVAHIARKLAIGAS